MIVSLDSQIIIWGIKKQAQTGQQDMIDKADVFFKWLDESGHQALISTIVIAEILAPEPAKNRVQYLDTILKNFMVVEFDTRCASTYAEILHGRLDAIKVLANEEGISRQKMKSDHLIIATALTHKANCIYSYDKGLKAFAKDLIDVKEFPTPQPVQPDLFTQLEKENEKK